jgi:hypothetical protein
MTTDGSTDVSGTDDSSTDDGRQPGERSHSEGAHHDGAHQGAGRWARRGAAGIGLPPGESAAGDITGPPTADGGDPDISPSLAGGHAGASGSDTN